MMAKTLLRAATGLLALPILAACHDSQAQLPTRSNFTAAVNDYLAQRGHLCIARYDWPVTVADAAVEAKSLDAQQMSLLESLGLVAGRDVNQAREYALTAAGQKYYLHAPVVVATATTRIKHPADFCVATLALNRVFGWEAPQTFAGRTVSSVLFSYQVVDPAPWMRTPDARRAFPMVMRAIDNAGNLQLRLGVHLTSAGWIADELSE